MDTDDGDSDNEVLVIDHDEDPKDARFNNEAAKKILTNDDKDIELKIDDKHYEVISGSKPHDLKNHCNVEEDEKNKGDDDDRRDSTQKECLEHKYVHKLKKCLIRDTSNGSDDASIHHRNDKRCLDPASPRALYKTNRANLDANMQEIGSLIRRRIEDDQTEDRRYTMDHIRPLNTDTHRQWTTHAYGDEVASNLAYRIQEPDAFRARINAYRSEPLNIEDNRYDTMNKKHYLHILRTDHDMYIDDYAEMSSNSYSHDHILEDPRSVVDHRPTMNTYVYGHAHRRDDPLSRYTHNHTYRTERFLNIDDRRHSKFNMNATHDYRPEHGVNIDDYRYVTLHKNVLYSTHRPDAVLDMDDFNQPIMRKHSYDVYSRQVALDPFRLQSEMAPSHGPRSISVDTGRLGSVMSRNVNYPEVSDVFIHSSHVTQNHPLTSDFSGNVNIGRKETALNLVCKERQALSQENPEPIIPYKKMYRIQKSSINQNKPNYGQSTTIADTIYTYNKNNRSENTVQMNVCEPNISDQINKTNNVGNHNSGTATLESIKCTNCEKCEVMRNNDINLKNNTTVDDDETARESNALAQEINELAGDNNIKFLVFFFTRVTELVKETFPEFGKSLQKEINTLGAVSVDGKVKTDIQYICPLYCSVSTYTLPCFHNMSDDNKIEKHVNRVKICDVCSCIQNCYKLYKKKYYDLLLKHLVENERPKETKEKTKKVIKSVGVCKNKPENISKSDTETDGNNAKEEHINKESLTNLEDSNIGQEKLDHVSLSAHENILKDLSYKITDKRFKLNLEKTIFDELSKLTFSLPKNDNITNSPVAPLIHGSSCGREGTLTNDSLNNVNQATPRTNQHLNFSQNNSDHNRNAAKNEPNLIFSLSPNEINNLDIIASKLKNKIYRRPDSVFTCHICTCMFTYYTSFVSHLQKEHNISDIDEEIPEGCIARKCQFCGYYSKQKYHNDHVRRSHPEIFAHKIKTRKIKKQKIDKRKKSDKRKFVFICLVCNESLMSYEVKVHREANHKGMNIPKMFTKRLLL